MNHELFLWIPVYHEAFAYRFDFRSACKEIIAHETQIFHLDSTTDAFVVQDPWKTTLLLRAKNELKKQEDDEDDLT